MQRLLLALTLFLTACASQPTSPDLARLYGEKVPGQTHLINPVIVIPGLLGSKLQDPDTGKMIWGVYENSYLNPENLTDLPSVALPLIGTSRPTIGEPAGALTSLQFKVLGVPISERAYAGILTTLGVGGFLDADMGKEKIDWGSEHFTCFQFDYDWRKSNAENAKELHNFILEKKRYVQQQTKRLYGIDRQSVKFNIVAHSMGGLLARYYLRHGPQDLPSNGTLPELNWSGAKHVEKLIMVGTPNSGSTLAFQDLIMGKEFVPKWKRQLFGINLPSFPAAVLATYPSLYELLPRSRHKPVLSKADDTPLDILHPEIWKSSSWSLLNSSQKDRLAALCPPGTSVQEQRKIAETHITHHLKRAALFHRSLDRPASPPSTLKLCLITGGSIETQRQVKIDLSTGEQTDNDYTPGDGVVTRSSALADERVGTDNQDLKLASPINFDQVLFLPKEHISLTTDPTFSDNLLHLLLEAK